MAARRILLVDAHRHSRRLYRIVLEHAGWAVRELSNGLETIDDAHRERPAAIVMELTLPFLDGPRTAEELKKDSTTSEIPILVLTAARGPNAEGGLLRGWWDGFLRKPCDPSLLLREIERLTARLSAPASGSHGHLATRAERRTLAVPAIAPFGRRGAGRFVPIAG
jgi:DNA-binding response OmpR family regulator